MRAHSVIADHWRNWWLEPQPLVTLALFRVVMSIAMIQYGVIMWTHAADYLGPHAFVSAATAFSWHGWPQLNLFYLIPPSLANIHVLLMIFMFFACCLGFGLWTRLSSLVTFVCLASFTARNPFIVHSGYMLLRLFSFYLVLSPCGRKWSLDALIARRFRDVDLAQLPRNGVAQRLIQLQIAFVYFDAFTSKLGGADWLSGSAVYYALQIDSFRFLPYPAITENPLFYKVATYYTLVTEFCMWALVWLKPFRYTALLLGCVLHLVLFWSLNIPLFQLVMLGGYLLFLDPGDFAFSASSRRRPQPA